MHDSSYDEPTRGSRWDELWPLAIVVALAALFFALWFNRFTGIVSGTGEFDGGSALLSGRVPYRDYYMPGPPLNQLKAALEMLLFGKTLIVTRIFGAFERLLLTVLLYTWLRRHFSRLATAIATLVTVIVSAGDRTDPLASYNHDAILFAMLCGFLAGEALRAVTLRRQLSCAVLSGVAAGLGILSKQTTGLGSTVAVLVIATSAMAALRSLRRAGAWLLLFLIGCLLPVLATVLYLHALGVLDAALRMLFVTGPAAKAPHHADFLRRDLSVGLDNWVWILLGLLATVMSARPIWRAFRRPLPLAASPHNPSPQEKRTLLRFGVFSFGVIALAELLALTPLPAIENFSKSAVYYTLFLTTLIGAAALLAALPRPPDAERLWQLTLLAAVGWSFAVTLSLSWPAFEAMALPGLGLLIAAAVDGVESGRPVLYALLAITVFFQVREKLYRPFSFGGQDEPSVRLASVRSTLPALRGMRFSPETVRLLDTATRLMQSRTPGATVYAYPGMGLFFDLSGRIAPTWSGTHNIDVVPDALARSDAARILAAQPAVILYAKPTPEQLAASEALWRHGRPSGQRDLIAVLDCLVSQYTLVDTFQLLPEDDPIRLYARPVAPAVVHTCPGLRVQLQPQLGTRRP